MKKIGLILIFLLLLTKPSYALIYSLVDDWSNLTNPNGPWSYNEGMNPLLYNVPSWPRGQFGAQTAWANSNIVGSYVPAWFKSVSSAQFDWLEGDVIAHSTDDVNGVNNGLANVTWTSPFSGIFDINGELWLGRDNGRSNDWNLYLDDILLINGNLFSGDIYSRANPYAFDLQGINVSEGSVLKLELVKTSDFGEFVGVNLNINGNPVPEPTTLFLFGTGLFGFFLRKPIKPHRSII